MKGFKEFILRGNLVDLAIAVVVGTAFAAVVAALIKDLITPLLAAIGGQPNFAGLHFTVNKSTFLYGDFINALITFLVIAAVLYFLVMVPVNRLMNLRKTETPVDPTVRDCPYCLSSVPVAASRCAFCTSQLDGAAGSTTGAVATPTR